MDEAVAAARSAAEGRLWIVSERQTAGRGRHGRTWVSEPGNLYATLLLRNPCAPESAPQLGFVAGLALRDALVALTHLGDRVRLKWPNDVLVDGAKLAGILLEGVSLGPDARGRPRHAVAIGFGVNVDRHPDNLPYAATSLAALGYRSHPLEVFQHLSDMMVTRLAQWAAGEDFPLVRLSWLNVAAGLRQSIEVNMEGEVLQGVFTEIDRTGRLVIQTPAGTRILSAGDMILRGERP